MYSEKEIELSLRKYIASTGNTAIDEQSIVRILRAGVNRNFDDASKVVKSVRQPFGVKRRIPEWLQMLTFRLIYDCMASDKQVTVLPKKQEVLLDALGFNKKVFDCTSSWNMYSPVMKLRQRNFEPVDFPFTYAEVESNPIYVAMIHHLVSEARVATNTFVDMFGKMGYIPAFCAEGYTNKLIFVHNNHAWDKYYCGVTQRPTKTYSILQEYMRPIDEVLKEKYNEAGRDIKIGDIISGMSFIRNFYSNDFSEHAAARFCHMCFSKPYWENRNVEPDSEERFIMEDYSSIKKAKKFIGISKDEFVSYAKALKKVKYIDTSDTLVSMFVKHLDKLDECNELYIDYDFSKEVGIELERICGHEKPFLYVDAPKYGEYKKFDFDSETYMILIESLLYYEGDWILTFKNYNHDREDADMETYTQNDFRQHLKSSKRPLYEYKYTTNDRNVRNGISFITTINFDELTKTQFEKKYQMKLTHGEKFIKSQVK